MEAVNTASGEVRNVSRERGGVIWCPFCDRSVMIIQAIFCQGCHAEFRNPSESDLSQAAPSAEPRTRRRASEPEVVAEEEVLTEETAE